MLDSIDSAIEYNAPTVFEKLFVTRANEIIAPSAKGVWFHLKG
jgi:hypothetical protein